jgi:hypothetical protein
MQKFPWQARCGKRLACRLHVAKPAAPGWEKRMTQENRMTPSQKQSHLAVVESMVDSSAAAIGLTIGAGHRPGVLANFERIAVQAQTLMEFALGDEVELAPVFGHDSP